jgi:hypothetical protein
MAQSGGARTEGAKESQRLTSAGKFNAARQRPATSPPSLATSLSVACRLREYFIVSPGQIVQKRSR